jgi:nicotinate-nucleotide pyrophosphorylase (carboxylating)
MSIAGPAHALLSAERVALNYLGHLSGIASKTAKLVALITHTEAKICDTRKTTPGLRAVEKYAVRAGGGANHRFGLYDAVLIKDNHIAVAGGITAALNAAQKNAGDLPIEIEVDTLAQFEEALAADAKIVLLDNMTPDMLRAAVALNQGRAILEASGRVSEDSVVGIAESGVDYISVGGITHSALTLDLGLDIDIS